MTRTYAALILAVVALAAPAGASATTFCVPTFHAACPDNGTNVAQSDLQTALTTDGKDGVADRVIIAAGTFTRGDSWELDGADTDDLEIAGGARADGIDHERSVQRLSRRPLRTPEGQHA
jgi:hypothetical protein